MNLVGRKKLLRRIENYVTEEPENKAFFGVKGLGKSALMSEVFSRNKCKEYAEEYQYLYVRTILMPEKKGNDLVDFLVDRVVNGLDLIPDEDLRIELQDKIKSDKEKFQSKDSVLMEALQTIKDYGYSMILVMDEFHNMGRDSGVGSNQYDFLRSLNEQGLVSYWIISDSDFSDVYATAQFTTSFFAQKFIPETLPQMSRSEMADFLYMNAEKYDVELSEELIEDIYDLIGGIPGFAVPAIKCLEMIDPTMYDHESFVLQMLTYPKCSSLLKSWCRSLTETQKDLLKEIAFEGKLYQRSCMDIIGRINQLGDNSGLGLLIHGTDDNGVYWKLNSQLLEEFIKRQEDVFYSSDIRQIEPTMDKHSDAAPTYIQNNYYTVNNNFFNPDGAIEALQKIRRLTIGNAPDLSGASNALITSAIKQLPYQQEEWETLPDTEKEEKLDIYADKVFDSKDFHADTLSDSQMRRFFLTPDILEKLSEKTRNNLISAIQVYDLLQFCVDRFGLNLQTSESARGILFAKLYESVLKEKLCPALQSIPHLAEQEIQLGVKNVYIFANAPSEQMTIGTFDYILRKRDTQKELGVICVEDIHDNQYDEHWWKLHHANIAKICQLRNCCCHSGNQFDGGKLKELIQYIFEEGSLGAVEIYDEIINRV